MSDEHEIAENNYPLSNTSSNLSLFDFESEYDKRISEHKNWLKNIRHERPNPSHHYNVGVYIRYFNQTKYNNYLDYHIQKYEEDIKLCPNWNFVGFYIDEGSTAPNMESALEWSRLLQDCLDGKIDLIITQKVSNVSKKPYEITMCSRLLAALPHPVGIYFISEDIFTLASYYQQDLRDIGFIPEGFELIPENKSLKMICAEEDNPS